ncbi:MAG: diadenylate cyclase CdaA [Lachnospiraceae bacterium]|nr:diadenylate cyclase CdaA [Lachnospiraceae bacterium]
MHALTQNIISFFEQYLTIPKFSATDMFEILIITFLFYEIMVWIKNTRAWMLFKGIVILIIFVLIATVFNLTTILWIADKTFNVGVIAAIIVFQPELRKALEQLGRKNFFNNFFSLDDSKNVNERFSDRTISELVKATYELAKHKTGALMVIENEINLAEYERTGINIDAEISNQLLINIFEHNTPLHDGAVIIRGNRIVSATCYLPLSDNMELSKELGTRHRAGVGVSEYTDSLTIIVSEETGKVSVAIGGRLIRNIDGEALKDELVKLQNKTVDGKRFKIWKGRKHNEKDINE